MVPEWLENYAKGSVSTAGYIPMGGKFGGKDIRKGMPKVRKNRVGLESGNTLAKILCFGKWEQFDPLVWGLW